MLVLTTMFVGVSQTLPHTSTIKMVDVWLVFNLLIPFIEVLIHSYKVLFLYSLCKKSSTENDLLGIFTCRWSGLERTH